MGSIAFEIGQEAADTLDDPVTADAAERLDTTRRPDSALRSLLTTWARAGKAPLVLLIDEIDSLVGDSLVSVLRQLRAGYAHRPDAFPQSVVLCGVRDVRDYRIHSTSRNEVIAGGSAFNIKAESLRLGDFRRAEVEALVGQHTEDTGQAFLPEAIEAVWEQTQGQPWLVNALCRQICFQPGRLRPRTRPIAMRDVFEAREALILRRDTHALQAFLHRVVNATGRIEREYALGSRRVDLLVVWPREGGRDDRIVIECKPVKDGASRERTVAAGLEQTAAYMDLSGTTEGHLVVFDLRKGRSWGDRLYRERREWKSAPITVWGA